MEYGFLLGHQHKTAGHIIQTLPKQVADALYTHACTCVLVPPEQQGTGRHSTGSVHLT